jgi:hypothetical protein
MPAEYLVIFKTFQPRQRLEAALSKLLAGYRGWSVRERHNAASSLPTDFLIVKVRDASLSGALHNVRRQTEESAEPGLVRVLSASPDIRMVAQDSKLENMLLGSGDESDSELGDLATADDEAEEVACTLPQQPASPFVIRPAGRCA